MRKIWMNFRGCDHVEPGMPCTVIPEDEYNSPNYYYKNGLDPAFMGKSGIVIRNNKKQGQLILEIILSDELIKFRPDYGFRMSMYVPMMEK